AWGRTGSSAGEHDAAKAAVHRWPDPPGAKASERTTASSFMANPLTELYRFDRQTGGQSYFFFGAGVGAGGVGLGATGAAAAGAFAAPGAAVPGLAWSYSFTMSL